MTKRVVGFSGGADSQATALWVRQRFDPADVILLNTQAGRNEHPITTAFVQFYSDTYFPVVEVVPLVRDLGDVGTKDGATGERRREFADTDELTFDRLAYVKGIFPSRKVQFCTEYLKLAPQKRWCDENLHAHGIDYERYIGVRRDESEDRKCASLEEFDDYFDVQMHRPLAEWTKQRQSGGRDMTPTVDVSEFTPDRIADLVLLVNVLDNRVRSQSAEIAGLRAKVEQLEALSAQLTEDYGQLAAATLPVHDHGEPVG